MNNEDADIKAAISAVAAYAAGVYKRDLVRRMRNDIEEEVFTARHDGKPIDTTELFKRLAEKYA